MANLLGAFGKSLEDWAYNTFYSDTQKKNDAAVKASNQQAQAHAQMKAGQINPVQYKRQAAIAANSIAPAYSAPAPQQQGYAPQAPSRPQVPQVAPYMRPGQVAAQVNAPAVTARVQPPQQNFLQRQNTMMQNTITPTVTPKPVTIAPPPRVTTPRPAPKPVAPQRNPIQQFGDFAGKVNDATLGTGTRLVNDMLIKPVSDHLQNFGEDLGYAVANLDPKVEESYQNAQQANQSSLDTIIKRSRQPGFNPKLANQLLGNYQTVQDQIKTNADANRLHTDPVKVVADGGLLALDAASFGKAPKFLPGGGATVKSGAALGGGFGLAYGGLQPLSDSGSNANPWDVAKSAGMGLAGGTLMGAAIPAIKPTYKYVKNASTAHAVQAGERASGLPKVNVLNDNEAYTLADWGDYLGKRDLTDTTNPKVVQEINARAKQAYHAAKNAGVDIQSGSARDIQSRIADYLERRDMYKQGYQEFSTGGSVPAGMFDPTGGRLGKKPEAPQPTAALKQEAREYKSVDDFVDNAMSKKKYDPTQAKVGDSVSVETVSQYGQKNKVVGEVVDISRTTSEVSAGGVAANPGVKNITWLHIKQADGTIEEIPAKAINGRRMWSNADYDHTPQQLTDLYNQAHAQPQAPVADPLAVLKQEALKYKSADEFVQHYEKNSNNIPQTPEYNAFVKKIDAVRKELDEVQSRLSSTDKMSVNDYNRNNALGKEYRQLLDNAPHSEVRTRAGTKYLREDLTNLYNKANAKPTLQDALEGKSTKIKETTSTAQELTPRQVQTSQPVASPQKTPQQSKQDPSLIQTPESGVSTPKNQGDANITLSTDNTRNVPKNQVRVKAGSGEKQVPVRNMTRDGDVIIATNVNKDIKAGEKRYSVDEDGKLIEDKKGATSLFTDKDGKVTGFRVGKEYFDAKQLGDLTSVNGYGSTLATMRRNVERAFDKPTGEKVNTFLVDHQQAQATKLIQRQVALKNEMQGLADDLGISFGIGSKKAKKVSAAIQDFGEGKRNKQNLVDEFGQVQANKIVKADKWFRKNYNSLLDEMNTTLKQFGYDPIPKRANYYTHFQDETLWKKFGLKMQEIRDLSSPTMQDANPTAGRGNISNKLAGMSENTVPNKAFNRFALKRKGDAHTSDAFKAFELYLNPTLNNIYMTPSIARARVIARAIAQDADIVGKDANKTIVQIREWANSLAGKSNRIGDRQLADTMAGPYVLKALGWAQKKTGQNSIIGNLSTTVMQPIVLGQTAGTFGYKNTLAGLYQQGLGSLNKAQGRSGFLTRRYSNVSPVTATKLDRGAVIANKPLEFVEENATRATWNAAYNDAVSQGMKGEKAIHYADINTEKTVSGRSIGEKPEAFRSKTAGLATMFQLEVNNFWQQTGKEMSKTQIAKTMVAMYGLNLLLQEMTGRQVGFNPIDALIDSYDEAMKERPSEGAAVGERAKRIGQRWVGEAVDNLPFVGMAVNTAFGEQTVKDWTGDDSNTGRFGVASPIRTLVDNPWMTVSPFGGSQVKKTVEAGMVLNDGALKDKDGKVLVNVPQTPGNIVRGLAFGKSAIPEVNQYYNNLGKNKVDQKQVQNQTGSKAGTMSLDGLTQAQQRMLSTARDDMKQHLIDRFRKENKDKYTADKAKDLNKPANDTPSTDAASQLLEANKMRAEDLKNSLSKEDYAISQLSKKDAQKLISEGKLTQQKLDGVNNYIANKKKELGYDTTTTSSGIRKGAEDTGWTDEYNAAKSKYDKESSSWNPVEKEKKGKELRTLDVKRHYSKEATSLYDMNEKDIYGFLDRQDEKKAQSYYKQIVEYGDKMVEAGLWSTNKLRDKYGNLQYQRGYVAANGKLAKGGSKSSGRATGGRKASTGRKPSGGSGGRSGGDVTSGKALLALQTGLNKIKTPRTTGKTPMPKSSVPVPPSFNKKNLRKFAVKGATLTVKKARA